MAEDKKKLNTVTEVKAFARGIHISPRKVRLLADLIRGLPATAAMAQLSFAAKKAAIPVRKLLASAVANASQNFQINLEQLYVKHFTVDGGRVLMRYMPRAQGRALPVRKRTSHLNLTLGVRSVSAAGNPAHAKSGLTDKKAKTDLRPEIGKVEPHVSKKKAIDPSQVGPKEEVTGKHYTGFDKKGNE